MMQATAGTRFIAYVIVDAVTCYSVSTSCSFQPAVLFLINLTCRSIPTLLIRSFAVFTDCSSTCQHQVIILRVYSSLAIVLIISPAWVFGRCWSDSSSSWSGVAVRRSTAGVETGMKYSDMIAATLRAILEDLTCWTTAFLQVHALTCHSIPTLAPFYE